MIISNLQIEIIFSGIYQSNKTFYRNAKPIVMNVYISIYIGNIMHLHTVGQEILL